MGRALYILWQWTWGLPQTLVGAVLRLVFRDCPRFSYQGAVVTVWPLRSGSISLGRYLFLHPGWTRENHALLAHEYGHTVQSLLLGPSYLLIIGLPSLLWAGPAGRKLRRKRKLPYSALYTEKWADAWGARFAKERIANSV